MARRRKSREELLAELRALREREPAAVSTRVPRDWRPGLGERDPLVRHMLEQMRAVAIEADAQGRPIYVSPTFINLLGYAPEELIGRDRIEWIHDDDLPVLIELSRKLRETGSSMRAAYRARHKSGHWVWLETASVVPYRASDGSWRTLSLTRDISDVKRAEEAVQESEARYRSLAEHASDVIFELDSGGRILFVSPNARAQIGRDPGEFVGRTIRDAPAATGIHPDDLPEFLRGFDELMAARGGLGQARFRFQHTDGGWRWLEARTTTYERGDGETHAIVMTRDVTEHERVQQRLRESEERYRILAEASHDLISESDAAGRCQYASHIEGKFLGYDPKEFAGATPFDLVHPDDIDRVVARFLLGNETGRPISVDAYRVRHKDGHWVWVEASGFNYRNKAGERRILGVTRDISDRVRAEEERRELAERMQQAQKLESLGVMAGGIAHDFNNLLTPILGDASLALADLPPDSPLRSRLKRIQKAARHAAALTNQMLAYAGAGALHTEPVQLPTLLREMGQLLESAVSRNIVIEYDLPEELPPIDADPTQLSQVVMNLLTNASEAIGESEGSISLHMGTLEVAQQDLERVVFGDELSEGRYVYFEVRDTGCGMDPATRSRIFDPFFTTKFTGRGLGLAAVLGIVRGHGGSLEIDTAPGRGTRIRVLFPEGTGTPLPRFPEAVGDLSDWRGEGTVLVVDDDDGAREVARDVLDGAGLRVLCASNGREGIELLRRHGDEIRMVLLDRTMPIASGEQTFDLMRKSNATTPIVLVSGFSEERATAQITSRGLAGFLHKPFQPTELLELARRLVEA